MLPTVILHGLSSTEPGSRLGGHHHCLCKFYAFLSFFHSWWRVLVHSFLLSCNSDCESGASYTSKCLALLLMSETSASSALFRNLSTFLPLLHVPGFHFMKLLVTMGGELVLFSCSGDASYTVLHLFFLISSSVRHVLVWTDLFLILFFFFTFQVSR